MKIDSPVPFEQRYELRDQLWSDGPHGGWIALDRMLGREVVVNLPYRAEDDERLLQSAQIRARLRHANLVPLYDLGATKDGRPFFTEPYIKATFLGRLLAGKDKVDDVSLPRLVSYLLDACKAIAYVHASGFLHLELHPSNVRVSPESQEVFVVCGHPSLPPVHYERVSADAWPGIYCGVPAYLAPEQFDPKKLGSADVLTDVYGLGGILFEILYDKPPNGGMSIAEIATAVAGRKGPPERGNVRSMGGSAPDLARTLEPICLRALEHDRTARPASVSAFMTEVEQVAWGRADSVAIKELR